MFDYTFEITFENKTVEIGYQEILKRLGAEDIIVAGKPLKEGGAPQAAEMKGMLEHKMGASIKVFYNGSLIL